MLSQIAPLREALATVLAHVGLDPLVHPHVVKEVASSEELLRAAFLDAHVYGLLPARARRPDLGGVLVVLEQLEVDVVLREQHKVLIDSPVHL